MSILISSMVSLTHIPNLHPSLVVPGEGKAEVAGEGDDLVEVVESLADHLGRLVRLGGQ